MIIEITDNKTIRDICEKFIEFFPFLKLEFYNTPHRWYEESLATKAIGHHVKIGDIRRKHEHGPVKIHSRMRTGDLEKEFKKSFDLNVQVLRYHGHQWIQTVSSDKLTLEEQNELGSKVSDNYLHVADSKTERENLF